MEEEAWHRMELQELEQVLRFLLQQKRIARLTLEEDGFLQLALLLLVVVLILRHCWLEVLEEEERTGNLLQKKVVRKTVREEVGSLLVVAVVAVRKEEVGQILGW